MSIALWFINSTAGRIVLAVVAFMVWLHFHDAKVADRARGECQAETLRRTLTETERQKQAADEALADAEKQQTATDAELATLKRQKEALYAELGKKSCKPVSPDVLERLRNIR